VSTSFLLHAPPANLLLSIEALTIHGCSERTEVDKALALRDTDDDALIVTIAVRLENRIANLVHPAILRSDHRCIVLDYFTTSPCGRQLFSLLYLSNLGTVAERAIGHNTARIRDDSGMTTNGHELCRLTCDIQIDCHRVPVTVNVHAMLDHVPYLRVSVHHVESIQEVSVARNKKETSWIE
jgi:hypothetical protein